MPEAARQFWNQLAPGAKHILKTRGLAVVRARIPTAVDEEVKWLKALDPDTDESKLTWYIDGSLIDGPYSTLGRTGVGFAAVNDSDLLCAYGYGLPPSWVTTTPSAEAWALGIVLTATTCRHKVVTDCLGNVTAITNGLQLATAANKPQARLWGPIFAALDATLGTDWISWMPSHTTKSMIGITAKSDGNKLTHIDHRANNLVDELAKYAARLRRTPVYIRKIFESAEIAIEHAAALIGVAGKAATTVQQTVTREDGTTLTTTKRDSVPLAVAARRPAKAKAKAEAAAKKAAAASAAAAHKEQVLLEIDNRAANAREASANDAERRKTVGRILTASAEQTGGTYWQPQPTPSEPAGGQFLPSPDPLSPAQGSGAAEGQHKPSSDHHTCTACLHVAENLLYIFCTMCGTALLPAKPHSSTAHTSPPAAPAALAPHTEPSRPTTSPATPASTDTAPRKRPEHGTTTGTTHTHHDTATAIALLIGLDTPAISHTDTRNTSATATAHSLSTATPRTTPQHTTAPAQQHSASTWNPARPNDEATLYGSTARTRQAEPRDPHSTDNDATAAKASVQVPSDVDLILEEIAVLDDILKHADTNSAVCVDRPNDDDHIHPYVAATFSFESPSVAEEMALDADEAAITAYHNLVEQMDVEAAKRQADSDSRAEQMLRGSNAQEAGTTDASYRPEPTTNDDDTNIGTTQAKGHVHPELAAMGLVKTAQQLNADQQNKRRAQIKKHYGSSTAAGVRSAATSSSTGEPTRIVKAVREWWDRRRDALALQQGPSVSGDLVSEVTQGACGSSMAPRSSDHSALVVTDDLQQSGDDLSAPVDFKHTGDAAAPAPTVAAVSEGESEATTGDGTLHGALAGRVKPVRNRDLANERKQNAKRARARADGKAAASAERASAATKEEETGAYSNVHKRVRLNYKTTREQAAALGYE